MTYSIKFKKRKWYLYRGRDNSKMYYFSPELHIINAINALPNNKKVKFTKNFPVLVNRR